MTQRVIVQTECKARGDFTYTQNSIEEALDVFFVGDQPDAYWDEDGEEPISRAEADEFLREERGLRFYNSEGERTVLTLDPSAN